MKLRRLGNTDLVVSEVALGTVELGLDYGIPANGAHIRPSEADAAQLLNEALDLGINFIDTARAYGNSEEIIGKALKHRRRDYLLATKISPFHMNDLDTAALRDHVDRSVEMSLSMLRTDYLDLLMIHSAPMELIQRMDLLRETLDKFKRSGKVRYLGASVYEEVGAEALRSNDFDCLQIGYNALDRRAETTILPRAAFKGVGIVARSVLLKGAITPRYHSLPPDLGPLKTAVKALEKLAHSDGMSLPELAFRYVFSSDVVALCGTARIDELRCAVEYADRGCLDSELIEQIRMIEVAEKNLLNPSNWHLSETA
jgi:aryl-alcohol dehydrogenase-like predicted oxidoreductase